MKIVYCSLGSNIGDRYQHIFDAINRLKRFFVDIRVAPIYESEPVNYLKQDNFLNTVISGYVDLTPVELLKVINEIEKTGGRNRDVVVDKGPRTIDIDILLFDSQCIKLELENGQKLIIPHSSMHERLFVLVPLLELAPASLDPRDNEPWSLKAGRISQQSVTLWK